jgi:hypothetical protein
VLFLSEVERSKEARHASYRFGALVSSRPLNNGAFWRAGVQ